jgi:regulator of RNase E activity RraB
MLSDEEKEAIETIKFFKEMKWYSHALDNGTEILSEDEKQDIDIVLNLIEKQSKIIQAMAEYIDNTQMEVGIYFKDKNEVIKYFEKKVGE